MAGVGVGEDEECINCYYNDTVPTSNVTYMYTLHTTAGEQLRCTIPDQLPDLLIRVGHHRQEENGHLGR